MPYFLVLLQPVPGAADPPEHEPFTDSLVARNLVLLGGGFDPPLRGADVAYVLRCDTPAEARQLVAEDPLVASGSFRAEVFEWRLVGVNPDAIEPSLVVRPSDIAL